MPEERLELSRLATHDFESCVSTIPPLRLVWVFYLLRAKLQFARLKVDEVIHLKGIKWEDQVMMNGSRDRHPKVRGGHALIRHFRDLYLQLQADPDIKWIIPRAPKKIGVNNDPEKSWPEEIQAQRLYMSDRPVGELVLRHGPISQVVVLHVLDPRPLRCLGFCCWSLWNRIGPATRELPGLFFLTL